ncbi:MAG: pyridoxamine 5'-phosphate oxidase family protein [Thermodesulfobacteriota bacterium]|nr:pyridoxamine 5'-phosphate oxidase family protein [Thermodesulfobacteriota bacterium]
MTLTDYFENTKGTGVLSTADAKGVVNAAIYSRPHILEDGTAAFIMRDRLTHANLQENPSACYLFREAGEGYKGKRLYLTRLSEEKETDRLYQLKRRNLPPESDADKGPKFLVIFKIEKELPLIGT